MFETNQTGEGEKKPIHKLECRTFVFVLYCIISKACMGNRMRMINGIEHWTFWKPKK